MTTVNNTTTGAKPTLPTHPPTTITRKPWPFVAQGDVLTHAQRLRAAARHALRAAALLEQATADVNGGAV